MDKNFDPCRVKSHLQSVGGALSWRINHQWSRYHGWSPRSQTNRTLVNDTFLAGEDITPEGSAPCDGLIGLDTICGFQTVAKVLKEGLDCGDTGGTTKGYDASIEVSPPVVSGILSACHALKSNLESTARASPVRLS